MRAKGKGQGRYNGQWVKENGERIENLEQAYRVAGGDLTRLPVKSRHLFDGKVTKHNPCGINHYRLRGGCSG